MSEHNVAAKLMLSSSQLGYWLMRNNSGALKDRQGTLVRFGLGNESKKLNDQIKSSDYIGIAPMVVTPEMVGNVIGVFAACETKPTDWKLVPSDDRGIAQKRFITEVRDRGGIACFVTNEYDLPTEVINWTARVTK